MKRTLVMLWIVGAWLLSACHEAGNRIGSAAENFLDNPEYAVLGIVVFAAIFLYHVISIEKVKPEKDEGGD